MPNKISQHFSGSSQNYIQNQQQTYPRWIRATEIGFFFFNLLLIAKFYHKIPQVD